MAATRMGFLDIFEPLYKVDKLKTSLLDGSLSSLNVFRKTILPLVEAHKNDDKFSIARIVKSNSPLFDKYKIKSSKDQLKYISTINSNVEKLLSLWEGDKDPQLKNIIQTIKDTGLFSLSGVLKIITSRTKAEIESIEKEVIDEENLDEEIQPTDEVIEAWDLALEAPLRI